MSDSSRSSSRRHSRFHGRIEGSERSCDWPGCQEDGEFRAPPAAETAQSRYDGPGQWRWYCLDHVRAFNQGYNFFDGMSADEIFEAQRPAAGWDRETRAFASAGGGATPRWSDFSDPLDAIGARFKQNIRDRSSARPSGPPLSDSDRRALKTLGLDSEATRATIRRAYSDLVRRYHPDRNGGDRSHETRLAEVIWAYTHLRKAPGFA